LHPTTDPQQGASPCSDLNGIAYRSRTHVPTLITAIITAMVSARTLVASLVFWYAAVRTLAFAGSLAVAGSALVGLTIHELSSEHVTHSLNVTESQRDHHLAATA
jgi:hypothetical protein